MDSRSCRRDVTVSEDFHVIPRLLAGHGAGLIGLYTTNDRPASLSILRQPLALLKFRHVWKELVPAMNHSHPLDEGIDALAATRKALIRIFARDGVVCADERAVLTAYDAHCDGIGSYRLRQVAAETYERNGITRHVRRQFEDAGAGLVDLAAERRERRSNVIAFPTPTRDEAS